MKSEGLKYLLENPANAVSIPPQVVEGAVNDWKKVFEGAWSLKDRSRSLQLTFVNLLNEDVQYVQDYFDSGTWYKNWNPILKAGSVNQGTVADKQGSLMTGVTGGIKLKIKQRQIYIYIGFNNPFTGSYKNFGQISTANQNPSYGYEHSNDNSPKNVVGHGYRLQIVQTESSIAQMAFVYTLSKA